MHSADAEMTRLAVSFDECRGTLFSIVADFSSTNLRLTLLWVQAEVHVDSQISCYLNSTIWTRYKPSRRKLPSVLDNDVFQFAPAEEVSM